MAGTGGASVTVGQTPTEPGIARGRFLRGGTSPPSDPGAFWSRRVRLQSLVLAAVSVPTIFALADPALGNVESYLPTAAVDLLYSFLRMLLGYVLSLAFAVGYGYFASTTKTGERILIPILDILQSVPILGFFPFVITAFVAATPGNPIGPNLASVFLIFTSMSWNMAFGVYESLKSLPNEIREATESFGARGTFRLRVVLFPATVNRLVYNSVLSWTAGWYYLVAAEFISSASSTTALPGIGTFLLNNAAAPGNPSALIAGLALLVTLIVALDLVLWRPLSRWAERYRYDTTPSGEVDLVSEGRSRIAPLRRAAVVVARGVRTGFTRLGTPFVGLASLAAGPPGRRQRPSTTSALKYVILGSVLILVWLLLIEITVGTFLVFSGTIFPTVRQQLLKVPLALGASFGRVVLAYALCVAISIPLAIFLFQRPSFARVGLPIVEVVASVPATALFPLFIFALLGAIHEQLTTVVMVMTGMIWYLFFNILSGLRGIPPDLAEAARSFGLSRREYYRRLALPAIVPAFITGSITAFGGGWNTLIIAEYLHYGTTQSLQVLGIGELIDIGNSETCAAGAVQVACGAPLMVAALLTLVFAVVAVNELLWKPLYRRAVDRYRID